jgi:hypothetical protein
MEPSPERRNKFNALRAKFNQKAASNSYHDLLTMRDNHGIERSRRFTSLGGLRGNIQTLRNRVTGNRQPSDDSATTPELPLGQTNAMMDHVIRDTGATPSANVSMGLQFRSQLPRAISEHSFAPQAAPSTTIPASERFGFGKPVENAIIGDSDCALTPTQFSQIPRFATTANLGSRPSQALAAASVSSGTNGQFNQLPPGRDRFSWQLERNIWSACHHSSSWTSSGGRKCHVR